MRIEPKTPLAPCPICAGKTALYLRSDFVAVRCTACNEIVEESVRDFDEGDDLAAEDAEINSAAAWSRATAPTPNREH